MVGPVGNETKSKADVWTDQDVDRRDPVCHLERDDRTFEATAWTASQFT